MLAHLESVFLVPEGYGAIDGNATTNYSETHVSQVDNNKEIEEDEEEDVL